MSPSSWAAVGLGAGIIGTGVITGLASLFARAVVTPSRNNADDVKILGVGRDHIGEYVDLQTRDPQATTPGRYSLWFNNQSGHAKIGDIISTPSGTHVRRRIIRIDRGDLAHATHGSIGGNYFINPTDAKQWLDTHDQDTGADIMQIVPSGPGFTTEPNLRLFTSIAHHAKHTLKLISPYFIPDESLMEAVTTACYRGVRVELYVSEKSDQPMVGHAQASYYSELLKAGVHMYLYPYPKVLHSKFAIADGEIAVMGSSNMDMRSFGLNYEISLMVGKGELLDALRSLTDDYRQRSALLTEEQWSTRPLYKQYVDNVARLTSALQ